MKCQQNTFSEHPQEDSFLSGQYLSDLTGFLDKFSSIITENIHVLDMRYKQLCYIKPDNLFLCGFSIIDLGSIHDFYNKILYPADLSLWMDIREAIGQYLNHCDEKQDEIDYFSCTFRLQRNYAFLDFPLPQMIFLRIKPDWENGECRYLICTARSSTAKEAGNLHMHHKNRSTYAAYHFGSKRWEQQVIEPLTEYEKAILMLAGQGYTIREISEVLCKGDYTVCNLRKGLYRKLGIHSMQEAIELANHHSMIYTMPQEEETQAAESSDRKSRISLTENRFQCIQQSLDGGKTLRQIAKQEGLTEGTIRYWIKKGKLKKNLPHA